MVFSTCVTFVNGGTLRSLIILDGEQIPGRHSKKGDA